MWLCLCALKAHWFHAFGFYFDLFLFIYIFIVSSSKSIARREWENLIVILPAFRTQLLILCVFFCFVLRNDNHREDELRLWPPSSKKTERIKYKIRRFCFVVMEVVMLMLWPSTETLNKRLQTENLFLLISRTPHLISLRLSKSLREISENIFHIFRLIKYF